MSVTMAITVVTNEGIYGEIEGKIGGFFTSSYLFEEIKQYKSFEHFCLHILLVL